FYQLGEARMTNVNDEAVEAGRKELAERIARLITEDGSIEPLEGVRLKRLSTPTDVGYGVADPAFCVIAQGSTEVRLGESRCRYDSAHYLVASAEVPIASRIIEASKEKPYLGFVLTLDPTFVGSVMVEAGHPAPAVQSTVKAIDVSALDADLLDAVLRLVR